MILRSLLTALLLLQLMPVAASVADRLQKQLNDGQFIDAVHAFYREKQYRPLWVSDAAARPRALALYDYLAQVYSKGLQPEDYQLEKILQILHTNDSDTLLELELLLTHALVRYSLDMYQGRFLPAEVDEDWHIKPAKLDVQKLLQQVHDGAPIEKLLDPLEPSHRIYKGLKTKLQFYREAQQSGGWLPVPEGQTLRPGMRDERVPLIRERLRMTGDLIIGVDGDPYAYNQTVREAVSRFQARHGLLIDGLAGTKTLAAMNVPVEDRIRQILVNLERWRWLPRKLGKRHLLVNLTGFEIYAVEHDRIHMALPIIIGKTYRETPSFSSRLSYFEINPYWTIPKKIVLEDLIPVQLRNPEYFAKKRIRIFDGWDANAEELLPEEIDLTVLNKNFFPFRFRQDPGPFNSLGLIKFMFPNPYDIYLHDTPQRYLFERTVRTFSSGCIRVNDPLRLTAYLLGKPTLKKEEELLFLIYQGENRSMSLVRPIPIYLVYWTAWVDSLGRINFLEDIYNRDKIMLNYL